MENNFVKNDTDKNEKKNKKRAIYILIFALCIFSVVSGGLYAYWAGNVSNPAAKVKDVEIVNVGAGKDVTTTLVVSDPQKDTKKLVPTNKAAFSVGGTSDNVETVTKSITVKWTDSENIVSKNDNVTGTLTVTATPEIQGAQSANWNLVNVVATPSSTAIKLNDDNTVTVNVTVTLREPSTKAVYDDIINKPILVHLNFSVAQ